jgi:hypothetical protein
VDAAERVRRGEIKGVTAAAHAEIAESLRSPTAPELIVATTPARSSFVLVEGHVRLTTYALCPELLPDELELYLAEAEDMAAWSEF